MGTRAAPPGARAHRVRRRALAGRPVDRFAKRPKRPSALSFPNRGLSRAQTHPRRRGGNHPPPLRRVTSTNTARNNYSLAGLGVDAKVHPRPATRLRLAIWEVASDGSHRSTDIDGTQAHCPRPNTGPERIRRPHPSADIGRQGPVSQQPSDIHSEKRWPPSVPTAAETDLVGTALSQTDAAGGGEQVASSAAVTAVVDRPPARPFPPVPGRGGSNPGPSRTGLATIPLPNVLHHGGTPPRDARTVAVHPAAPSGGRPDTPATARPTALREPEHLVYAVDPAPVTGRINTSWRLKSCTTPCAQNRR